MILQSIQFLYTESHKWVVLIAIIFIIIALYKEFLRPASIFLLSTVIFILLGIITPEKFLKSFSNPSISIIILLILITSALRKNYNIDDFLDKIFSKAKTGKGFLWRMSIFVSLFSSFFNNTPIVAAMVPYVYNWSRKNGIYPSKLFIPLSYFTILGGMITVIGTSTNLVLNGFLGEKNIPLLHFTDFLYLGIIVTCVGIIYIYTLGYKLLPEKEGTINYSYKAFSEYIFEIHVKKGSKIEGKTVEEASITQSDNAYLIGIHEENGNNKTSFYKDVIKRGDTLIFMKKSNFKEHANSSNNSLKLKIFLLVLIGIIICGFLGIFSLFTSVLSIFTCLFIFKLFSVEDLKKQLDIDLVIILGCALSIGNSLIDSGAAQMIVDNFMILQRFGSISLLISLFVLTVVLTSFITNVAAISIAFPVTYSFVTNLSIENITPFFVAITFASSAAFISPISYQTNWMVYKPGNYTSKDFFKIGFPFTIIYSVVCITFIILYYELV